MKTSDKGKPKGRNQGKTLSPSDQEGIRQLYAVYGNKREVARKMGVCEKTVHNVLNDVSGAEFDKARAEAALETAGRVQSVVHRVIDKIDDEKIDRASLPQAFVAIGIGIDKIERLQIHAKGLREQDGGSGLLTPGNIEALVASIKGRVNKMTILGIKIEQQSPELLDRLQTAMLAAEMGDVEEVEVVEAETETPELDFYNAPSDNPTGLPDASQAVD